MHAYVVNSHHKEPVAPYLVNCFPHLSCPNSVSIFDSRNTMKENDQGILVVCLFISFDSLFYFLLAYVSSHHNTSAFRAFRFVRIFVPSATRLKRNGESGEENGLFVFACGTGACVWYARVCGIARSHVCAKHDPCTCKDEMQKENGAFHVYYPPAIVCCSYIFVCKLMCCYITCILPYLSVSVLICYSYVVVCYSYEVVCYSYVTRAYSYVTRTHSYVH